MSVPANCVEVQQTKLVNRRDFLKLARHYGPGFLGAIAVLLGGGYGLIQSIPKDVRDAASSRRKAKDIADIKIIDPKIAWNRMYELVQIHNMPVAMDETIPHQPRLIQDELKLRPIASNDVDKNKRVINYWPSFIRDFQFRAQLFFNQNKDIYIEKAKKDTGNLEITKDEAFSHFFLNEFLPKIVYMGSRHNISLDALVMWFKIAEEVTGISSGLEHQNKDISDSKKQILFSYIEMLAMENDVTLLTGLVKRFDFQGDLVKSFYDAPRLSKVTIGWSDLEPSLLARGLNFLDEETKENIKRNHPFLVDAINKTNESRNKLPAFRNILKTHCNYYARNDNSLLDRLLQNKDDPGWVELGFDKKGNHGLDGQLWMLTNYTHVWAEAIEKIEAKNNKLKKRHQNLSDYDVKNIINKSLKTVKNNVMSSYNKNGEEGKQAFIKDQMGNPQFLSWLIENETNPQAKDRVFSILQTWQDFTAQMKDIQNNEFSLIKELGKLEYDFDLQLALNIGVMKERLNIVNQNDTIADEILHDSKKLSFSEWQSFFLMTIREIAPLPILDDESEEYWGRFSLIDEPYDPEKTLFYIKKFIEKVDHYFAPPLITVEPFSLLWRTINVVRLFQLAEEYEEKTVNKYIPKLLLKQVKNALQDKEFIEIARILGVTLPSAGSFLAGINTIDQIYQGTRFISVDKNRLQNL